MVVLDITMAFYSPLAWRECSSAGSGSTGQVPCKTEAVCHHAVSSSILIIAISVHTTAEGNLMAFVRRPHQRSSSSREYLGSSFSQVLAVAISGASDVG